MNVRVYSTPTCPWCDRVKEYLKDQGVAYESIDVSKDREMARQIIAKTHQRAVPITEIGETYIVGFDRPRIDEALREAGLSGERSA